MKLARRLVTLAIVLAMVMAFMIPSAMAAGSGTIKIENTVAGKEYSIYKVFDATYSGTNVVYTYDGSNATFLAALQAATSPFDVALNTAGTYNVTLKTGADAAAVSDFLTANKANLGTATTKNGDGNTVTVNGLDYGYYYITTTTGANVTIDSVAPTATVIDKNTVVENVTKTANATEASIGETINYTLTGTISRYNGQDRVETLVFTDTMAKSLTPNNDIVVKVAGVTLTKDTDYTVATSTGANDSTVTVITLTVSTQTGSEDAVFKFENGAAYEITYSAVVNENVLTTAATNKVDLKVNGTTDVGATDPEVSVKTYKITLTKEDANNATKKLAGAKFKLYDAATGGNEIKVVLVSGTGDATSTVDNVYRIAKSGETGVDMVTGTTGIIVIQGLGNGDYYFEETEAPAGYNKLTARTPVTSIASADGAITVQNNTGTELPSTGGMGTTIFYIAGSLMFLGALVILVTNKRMRAN